MIERVKVTKNEGRNVFPKKPKRLGSNELSKSPRHKGSLTDIVAMKRW